MSDSDFIPNNLVVPETPEHIWAVKNKEECHSRARRKIDFCSKDSSNYKKRKTEDTNAGSDYKYSDTNSSFAHSTFRGKNVTTTSMLSAVNSTFVNPKENADDHMKAYIADFVYEWFNKHMLPTGCKPLTPPSKKQSKGQFEAKASKSFGCGDCLLMRQIFC